MSKKPLEYYLEADYPFNVRPDTGDGGYIVEYQDLRYCVGRGDSISAAIEDSMIAKEERMKAAYEDGINIPEPGSSEEFSSAVTIAAMKEADVSFMTLM